MAYGTEYGKRLAAELLGRPNAISRLYTEWKAGNLNLTDLRDLLPQIWTREPTDSPEGDRDNCVRRALPQRRIHRHPQ